MTAMLIVPAIWVAGAVLLVLLLGLLARRHRQREARVLRGWDPDFDD